MNTRREFIRQIAIGAGVVAMTPQVLTASNNPYRKQPYEDVIEKVSDGAFVCLKNWFDCSEEELITRIKTLVQHGICDRSNGGFNPVQDEFLLAIPHWSILRLDSEFTQAIDVLYPNCQIAASHDTFAYAAWNNLVALIGYKI